MLFWMIELVWLLLVLVVWSVLDTREVLRIHRAVIEQYAVTTVFHANPNDKGEPEPEQ
jgi:hypothetical protein